MDGGMSNVQKGNIILEKTFQYALLIIDLYKFLIEQKKEFVMSKQLLRSGTSIGANAEEAQEAESKADFIHKFSISNKECREAYYWLRLLDQSGYLEGYQKKDEILGVTVELKRMITSIINSSKR